MNKKNIIFGLCMIVATPLCAMELSDPDRIVELEGKTAFKQFHKSQMNLKKHMLMQQYRPMYYRPLSAKIM